MSTYARSILFVRESVLRQPSRRCNGASSFLTDPLKLSL